MKPKLVITDIDGVWTDGGMYYDQAGNELKKFNTSDSAGVIFLQHLDIPLVIITGEDTEIVKRRALKLGVKYLYMGVKDKVKVAKEICDKLSVNLEDVAFIGDDIGDLALLKLVGFSCVPANAPDYVKQQADLVLQTKGGDGAFRIFVEHILKMNNLLESCVEAYIAGTRK